MDPLLALVEGSNLAVALRSARWSYAAINTAHVLGIALLVGAIVPLDLRLLGLWRGVAHEDLARVLLPVAALGLALAVTAGGLMFSVRASEYAALTVFRAKLALIAVGASSAIAVHLVHGWTLGSAPFHRRALAGATSIGCWLGALVAGRMIAFVVG